MAESIFNHIEGYNGKLDRDNDHGFSEMETLDKIIKTFAT
jgi:hypothetical protein